MVSISWKLKVFKAEGGERYSTETNKNWEKPR